MKPKHLVMNVGCVLVLLALILSNYWVILLALSRTYWLIAVVFIASISMVFLMTRINRVQSLSIRETSLPQTTFLQKYFFHICVLIVHVIEVVVLWIAMRQRSGNYLPELSLLVNIAIINILIIKERGWGKPWKHFMWFYLINMVSYAALALSTLAFLIITISTH